EWSCHLRFVAPADWTKDDIYELCSDCGVESVWPTTTEGTFIATFASAEAAVAAHPSLADISDLQCDLVPEEPEEQPEAAQEQPE
ncbi:unnamed protein product, partial [Polarella glacialis]